MNDYAYCLECDWIGGIGDRCAAGECPMCMSPTKVQVVPKQFPVEYAPMGCLTSIDRGKGKARDNDG